MTDKLIRAFIAQAEACKFTDDHGHKLEMNGAYIDLKASVERDPAGNYYADPDSPPKE